jgi:hypothetical protein
MAFLSAFFFSFILFFSFARSEAREKWQRPTTKRLQYASIGL